MVRKMLVAVIHNINQSNVVHRFGIQNREMYFRDEIDDVILALQNKNHVVEDFDGDKFLIPKLESFIPAAKNGSIPEGIALNLAYGIQGNCRYSHIPSILEMAGIPYTGSTPLAHSLALDKEMAKRILLQAGILTPRFVHVDRKMSDKEAELLGLTYPLIIKPENEAASFGISVVNNSTELVSAVSSTLDDFHQPLLIEEFLCGREFNVGVMGNGDLLEVFDPVEIDFTGSNQCFQSYEGKKQGCYSHICPPDIPDSMKKDLKEIAIQSFTALKCNDYARIDFRLDKKQRPHVLELNSMAAIHRKGSFFIAASHAGYDYSSMLNKIIKVANRRYSSAMEI